MRRALNVITLLLAVALMHVLPAYAASADRPATHHTPPAASAADGDDHAGHVAHSAQVESDHLAAASAPGTSGTPGTNLDAGTQTDQQHGGHGVEHVMHLCLAILTSLLLALAGFFALRLAPPTATSISRRIVGRRAGARARAPDLTALCVSRT